MATVLTNGGKGVITGALHTMSSGKPEYLAIGTGAGTAAATDTTLFTESGDESRVAGTSSQQTTTTTNDTYRLVGTITIASNNKTVTNIGIFTASTGGTLFMKGDFTGLPLNIGDALQITVNSVFS